MRIVYMGTPEFAVPPLEHLLINKCGVVSVYTRPDRLSGRGRRLVPPPVKVNAQTWGLPVVQPASLKLAEVVAQLAGLSPDVIVVAAFGQILPSAVLDIPRYGCFNLHPSLLPKFRGASPVAAAILAGDAFTGVSIMLMDQGLDTGPVLARAQIPISAGDTTGSLTAKLSQIAARLLPEALIRRLNGELTAQPQNEAGASYSGEITKEEGEVDWCLSAVDIWRRVRAFQPWPGCYTRWRGKQLKIIEAVPLSGGGTPGIGRVVALPVDVERQGVAFGVGCGEGMLGIRQVQMEGKRAMASDEFLRGQRQFMGVILPHPA